MSATPISLSLAPNGVLTIEWDDGQRRLYSVGELRRSCPCAGCQGHGRQVVALLPPSAIDPRLSISGMAPVGSYGYNIRFSDGHETGIYTLELLQRLGTPAESLGS